jgi:alpha-glucosidase
MRPLRASAPSPLSPWWQGAVIYHVYLRSFADSNGDGIGDLPGLTGKLDYIADLGVDALWVSPFFKSPMNDFGYDISDHCDIDPIFGTMADCEALLEKAHRLGLKVVIDQVYSHTSDQHRWFQTSRQSRDNPYAAWYVWHDARPDGTPPNNWQSVFGGPAWTWDARRRQYYMHNFLASQPDLNVHHPETQEAIRAIARFWLDKGVDGLRLDAANFFMHDRSLTDNPVNPRVLQPRRPYEFQLQMHNISQPENLAFVESLRRLTEDYEGRFMVAELGEAPFAQVAAYTVPGLRCHTAYDFSFLYQKSLAPGLVGRILTAWEAAAGGAWPSWTFSNHDAPRALSRWFGEAPSLEQARLLNALLLCLRGTAFLYYGEELGLPQARVAFEDLVDPEAIANWPHTLGRDGARTPMPWSNQEPNCGFTTASRPWLPIDPRHVACAADRQAVHPDSVLSLTRRALAARRNNGPLRWGTITFPSAPTPLEAIRRDWQDESCLCLFNVSSDPVPLPDLSSFLPSGCGSWQPLLNVNGAACDVAILPPWGALWLTASP